MSIVRAVKGMVARGVVSIVSAASKMQTLQLRLTAAEPKDGVEHFEPYGFTAHPHPGSEAIALFVGADRSHGVAVVVGDRRYRLTGLKAGEVALYTDEGDTLVFKRGREISITSGSMVDVTAPQAVFNCSASVTLNTPKVFATGDIEADGEIRDSRGTMSQMRSIFDNHDHPNGMGGDTDTPNQKMTE